MHAENPTSTTEPEEWQNVRGASIVWEKGGWAVYFSLSPAGDEQSSRNRLPAHFAHISDVIRFLHGKGIHVMAVDTTGWQPEREETTPHRSGEVTLSTKV